MNSIRSCDVPYDVHTMYITTVFLPQVRDLDTLLNNVLDGGFSVITFKRSVQIDISSKYTDSYGQSPFYMSREEFNILACLGWGIRQVLLKVRQM